MTPFPSPSPSPSPPLPLAIIGGGISGLTLSHALTTRSIPHKIYESAPSFAEIGAGIGFQAPFVRTMGLVGPRVREAFLRCSTREEDGGKWFEVRIGDGRVVGGGGGGCEKREDGEDTDGLDGLDGLDVDRGTKKKKKKEIPLGETIFAIPSAREPGPRGGVHRAHFLDELVKLLPPGIAQFNKRLVEVREAGNGGEAELLFADGTTARHSAVIGCDGIKARTREIVLGKEEARPVFSGKYAYRGVIPMEKAVEILGDEEEPRSSQMYCGYGGHVLTFPIARGTMVNVVAFHSKTEWTDPEWVVKTSREATLADYASWTPKVKSIMAHIEKPDIWALFNHVPARTFYLTRPRICLLGDAAHASTPHQGSGAGMCIEDCYVLSELLGEMASADELDKVFRAYEEVRRPRTLRLVETSREAGMLWDLEGPEGDDLDAFERNACSRMDWIWQHDIQADVERARRLMRGIPSPSL